MKMYQMTTQIRGTVRGVFTDTIIFEGDIIGGIWKTSIKEFTKCMNTLPRASKYIEECPKPLELKKILNILN